MFEIQSKNYMEVIENILRKKKKKKKKKNPQNQWKSYFSPLCQLQLSIPQNRPVQHKDPKYTSIMGMISLPAYFKMGMVEICVLFLVYKEICAQVKWCDQNDGVHVEMSYDVLSRKLKGWIKPLFDHCIKLCYSSGRHIVSHMEGDLCTSKLCKLPLQSRPCLLKCANAIAHYHTPRMALRSAIFSTPKSGKIINN